MPIHNKASRSRAKKTRRKQKSKTPIKALQKDLLEFKTEVRGQFDEVNKRFSEVDKRFDEVDKRFDEVDKRFDEVDIRFDKVGMQMMRSEERLAKKISDGIESVKAVVESIRHDNRTVAEAYQHTSKRLDNHEERITDLEKRP